MADVAATVEALTSLQTQSLPSEWIKEVWEKDFTDFDPLPLDTIEEVQRNDYYRRQLCEVLETLAPWVKGQAGSSGEGFWTVLLENDLSHKSIVSLLFYIMEIGEKRKANAVQKEACVIAANCYVAMVMMPGSGAFKIFHPVLYQKIVDAFKIWSHNSTSARKRRSSSTSKQKGRPRGKCRKTSRSKQPVVEEEEDPFAEDEEEDEEITPSDMKRIHKALMEFLRNFVRFLRSYSLKDNPESSLYSIQIMADLTKHEPETFYGNFNDVVNVEHTRSIPQLAYMGLSALCTPSHGDVTTMVTTVFKYLMPWILMLIGDNKGVAAQAIPRAIILVKDHAVSYVRYLIKCVGETVLPSVRILLQHMCTKVPDKSEYRTKVGQAIVDIMKELPPLTYSRLVEWIYKYSRNAKIGYRVFALDVVSCLLCEKERELPENVPAESALFLSHRFLIQIMLSRCSDIAPTVRARAIQCFAQCSSSSNPVIKNAVREIITPRGANRAPVSRVVPTPQVQKTKSVVEQDKTEDLGNGEHSNSSSEQKDKDKTEGDALQPGTVNDGQSPASNTPAQNKDNEQTPSNKDESSAKLTPVGPASSDTPIGTVVLTPGSEITLTDGQGMSSMLRRRAADEKVNVRKSALVALENIIRVEEDSFNKMDLDVLHQRCLDPALSVRKQAMMCLTELLMDFPHNRNIQFAWLDGVLPMVVDRETGAQEKCLDTIEEVIVGNIVPYERSRDEQHLLAWSLLNLLASNEGVDIRRFLQKACQLWGRANKLRASLSSFLQTHVNTENNEAAWLFLSELAPFTSKTNYKFVLEYWKEHSTASSEMDYTTMHRVLVVLGYVAKNIPAEESEELSVDLKNRIMQFNSPPELTAAIVTALNKLCQAQTKDRESATQMTSDWFAEGLKACDTYLSEIVLNESKNEELDEDKLIRHLFTLGEIAQMCPARLPKRIFMLVQSLIASPVISTVDGSSQQQMMKDDNSDGIQSSQRTSTGSNNGLSQRTSTGSDDGLTQFQGISQCSQGVLSQFQGSRMSNKIRAYAFVTLGKLCLQHEELAKKCIAAMARELETATDPAIRNNVVIIMCDLCVRYTSVVDRYVPNVAACLKDKSPLIRKQTLTLLTHLLQEDFLKWKGSLFYRFIVSIVDDDKEIKEFAEFCLEHLLLQRHPGMFFHHFIECIFHFNCYDGHRVYNKFPQTDREKEMFSMKGRANASKRMYIYRFMLEHNTDEQRFQITAKLSQEILGAIVDAVIPLDCDTAALLQDALGILASKEIKLSSLRAHPQDDAVEEMDMAQAVMSAAKKTVITQVVKKNVIENIVPTVIGLKHMLEQNRSSVQHDLLLYLRELMKDYKNEVQEILAADRQTAKEIEYDLRKFEEQEEEERQRQLEAKRRRSITLDSLSNQGTPTLLSPTRLGSALSSPKSARGKASRPDQGTPVRAKNTPARPKGTPSRVQNTPRGTQHTPDRQSGTPAKAGSPRAKTGGTPVKENQPHTLPDAATPGLGVAGTPRQNISRLHALQPTSGSPSRTPGRNISLSTQAILNSARKAMQKAQQPSAAKPPPSPRQTPQKKKVGWADSDSPMKTSRKKNTAEEENNPFKTPNKRPLKTPDKLKRAISTPAGANLSQLGNITFLQGAQDLSIIPPSPIPSSLPLRLDSGSMDSGDAPSTPSWTTRIENSEDGPREKHVLHMFSPDQPAPRPKVWNIRSSGNKSKKSIEKDQEEEQMSDKMETPKTLTRKTRSSIGRRRTSKSEVSKVEEADDSFSTLRRSRRNSRSRKSLIS